MPVEVDIVTAAALGDRVRGFWNLKSKIKASVVPPQASRKHYKSEALPPGVLSVSA